MHSAPTSVTAGCTRSCHSKLSSDKTPSFGGSVPNCQLGNNFSPLGLAFRRLILGEPRSRIPRTARNETPRRTFLSGRRSADTRKGHTSWPASPPGTARTHRTCDSCSAGPRRMPPPAGSATPPIREIFFRSAHSLSAVALLLPFSPFFRHDSSLYHAIMQRLSGTQLSCQLSRDNVERSGKHIQFLAMQREHFPIDHDVDGSIQLELDAPHGFALGQRMFDMRPVIKPGRLRISPTRPIGPQRTYSTKPSSISALGAIIIVPPVNLLLLKVRNRQGRLSKSFASSTRTGKGRRLNRARVRNIDA